MNNIANLSRISQTVLFSRWKNLFTRQEEFFMEYPLTRNRNPSVTFLGGGEMGGAMLKSYTSNYSNEMIRLVETDVKRQELFRDIQNITITSQFSPVLNDTSTIVIAVKPNVVPKLAKQLKILLKPEQLVISIAAGVNIDTLTSMLEHRNVVRVMPNIPAKIGRGLSIFLPSPTVSSSGIDQTKKILGTCGLYLQVEDDKAIDAATAISGSGPAYIFYLVEHMCKAAEELGFSEKDAKLLVHMTLKGSSELWENDLISVGKLRKDVTSPGGTTEAAINYFEQQDLGSHIQKGIRKAFCRAVRLSNEII